MTRKRRLVAAASLVLVSTTGAGFPNAQSVVPTTSFVKTETITRTHLVHGANVEADTRKVTVQVSTTSNIRDRQAVTVSWAGAHPSGGLVSDHNSAAAAQQEYPVVVMQCRGVDSPSAPVSKRIRPQSCWTQTPAERFQYSPSGALFPSFRMDRYAVTADRAIDVNKPASLPSACPDVPISHWVPFAAADGTVYPGGILGCAGLAPEAANSADSLQPGSTTYGVADTHGNGSTKFVMQSADSNASLGCSATVPCSLVVIPIMGLSCDTAGTASGPGEGMPVGDRPDADLVDPLFQDCSRAGRFAPGDFANGGIADVPVTGALWWAASNWRNRIAVPLTFAPSASVCDVVSNSATAYLYGSEGMAQATQQWSPAFCLDPKLFTLRHVQTSEPQAKNLLRTGNIQGAIQAGPPATPFAIPTVQAPAALTGFAVAYSVDGADGNPYPTLKLNARLLAKLLSESYRTCAGDCLDFTSKASVESGFAKLRDNPIDLTRDPEFQALNPGIPSTNYLQSAGTIEVMSSDSDLMTALSSYINADPEARAWLDGAQDPWGMVVNPAYKSIALPVANWPLLDTHLVHLAPGGNPCLDASPVPWLPLVASPVSNPATVALHMQFDIANSQTTCKDGGTEQQKLTAIGRQSPSIRFVLGLVSLGDATRYQLSTAALQTQRTSTGTGQFTDAAGRSFVAPTDAALRAAGALLRPSDELGTWPIPYDTLRTDPGGAKAYPGTVLMSIDVPTKGLPAGDAQRYGQLLHFAAGPGQTPGLASGDLPPGYLPLSAANGLAALAGYTNKAADAVAAQSGVVPFVSGRPTPTGPSTPTTGPATTGNGSSNGGTNTPAGPSAGSTPGSSARPSAPGPAPSAAPSANGNAQAVGKTTGLGSGWLGLALPFLALLALVALGASALTSGVGRRR
jgi:hypothetical protein